jgi:acetyl esterase/lipase
VDSALVAFRRRELPEHFADIKRLVEASFAHRRKTLPNSLELSGLASRQKAVEGLAEIGRVPDVRAEALEPPEFVALARDCYVPGMTDEERRAPEVSPCYADLRGLPPCFVSVGTSDHLFDDSLTMATRGAAAGVDIDFCVLPELPHAFQVYDCGITRDWAKRQTEWMAAHIG